MFLYTYYIILLQYDMNNVYHKHQMENDMPLFPKRDCVFLYGAWSETNQSIAFFHPWLRGLRTRCTFFYRNVCESVKQIYEWDVMGFFRSELLHSSLLLLLLLPPPLLPLIRWYLAGVKWFQRVLVVKPRHPLTSRHRRLVDRSALCTGASGGLEVQ